MVKVAIQGAAGRMGRMLVKKVVETEGLELSGATEVAGNPLLGQDAGIVAGIGEVGVKLTADLDAALDACDVIIAFNAVDATMDMAPKAAAKNVAMVIGTTGLNPDQKATLAKLASDGARIVFSPNMSIGVNLLFALCAKVGRLLDEDYDIEIIEMHHNQKKDAPSGTAARLGEILCEARGLDYEKDVRHGRVGMPGARTKKEIGMHSLRGGDVVGDHTVVFATSGERIELTHKASSRETFTRGAARAALFLANAKPGLYDMQDVLGLK